MAGLVFRNGEAVSSLSDHPYGEGDTTSFHEPEMSANLLKNRS